MEILTGADSKQLVYIAQLEDHDGKRETMSSPLSFTFERTLRTCTPEREKKRKNETMPSPLSFYLRAYAENLYA